MEQNNLNITTNSGSQSSTESPQNVGGGGGLNSNASTNSLQSINSSKNINSHSTTNTGLKLSQPSLPTVNLNNLSSGTLTNPNPSLINHQSKHNVNSALLLVAAALFLAAVISFWWISKGANSTTE